MYAECVIEVEKYVDYSRPGRVIAGVDGLMQCRVDATRKGALT